MLRQLTLICMAILLAALPANAAKPNIVFVLADDMTQHAGRDIGANLENVGRRLT